MTPSLPTFSLLRPILEALGRSPEGGVEVVGPWGAAKTLLAVQTAEARGCPLLVVAPGRIEAEAIHDDLITFTGEDKCALFPAWEVLPTDTMSPADDIVAERMNTLKRLATALERGEIMHAVFPVRSLLQYVIHAERLSRDSISLQAGQECDLDDLLERLIKMGYHREIMVERRGEISLRGGIFDIFPISSELPYRIEFFGDEIESIRRFEPETQRSIERLDEIQILPRSEKTLLSESAKDRKTLAAITSYFPKNALVVLDEPLAIAEEAEKLEAQFAGNPYHMTWAEARGHLTGFARLSVSQVSHDPAPGALRLNLPMRAMSGWAGRLNEFWEQLRQWDLEGVTVRIFCVNSGERRRLYTLLEEQGYIVGQGRFDLQVEIGRLRPGFSSAKDRLAVLSERELFGRHYMRRVRRRFEAGESISQFGDLKTGDFVVHEMHGIGRYLGLKRFAGRSNDYMTIQYAGGDTVYIPVTNIDQVQKYIGGDGSTPKMDRIGGASWTRKKARVKKAVRDMTADLVRLYAERESREGHAFAPDTPWQTEFEDAFEYDETPDQARAIDEVKRDMEAPRPMDRLLCGDVGYGKTEVALRAAFKAAMDGLQAAFLAPTTVLAQQHYQTFSERLADYPIRIELLSRFRTPAEIKRAIDGLKSGEVDLVIGTHRLLSKDIHFKNLGLVIIDEEQRFGVAHKERLKQLRTHVDVLTLSATPIPRTLHMSLIGVRDMSVINTAPNDRLPIHTCIEVWDENLVREAILREIGRQGQVFFLHNRVQSIERVATQVQRLVPDARIAIGHGQMPKHELEEVMLGFVNKEIDVLICTTIIGSGIDIPNANTIIIDRADTFGLSELYQIRGRVGRYKHRAFAYLMIPGDRALSEEAQQRLKALEDFSALGSGFRIAMRDLEIRGCGNLLGGEQHGQIAAVGYETYRDLIAEAVSEMTGAPPRRRLLPPFDVAVDAFIPEEYIPTAQQKMTLYRRIAAAQSFDEVREMREELKDRFGAPPRPVLRLLEVMEARALAGDLGVRKMAAGGESLTMEFESPQFLSRSTQHHLREALPGEIIFSWEKTPAIRYHFPQRAEDPVKETLRLLHILQDL
jgi:transcription-repair coupling factor (superfamily II helicase)